jgi:predicted dehydrogenase
MIKVGLAGLGFMGVTHFKAWPNVEGAELVALCEMDEQKLSGDWSDVKGNFGEGGGVQDLSAYQRYSRLEDMLAEAELDLVDICLPTRFHPEAAIASLQAGIHTSSEKPIALSSADGERMVAAAQQHDRLLFVGHVLRVWPEWAWLKQVADSGEYGRLLALNLRRVIAMPAWSASLENLAFNGGPLVDLHIHDVNFLQYLLGKPASLHAVGSWAGSVVRYAAVNFNYPDGPVVSAQGGIITQSGRAFNHEYEAYFERANICHSAASEPAGLDPAKGQSCNQAVTVYHPDGTATFPDIPAGDPFTVELQHVTACVAAGRPSPILDPVAACDSLRIVELEAESVRTGQIVEVP